MRKRTTAATRMRHEVSALEVDGGRDARSLRLTRMSSARTGVFPLLRVEKGFEAVVRSGPGYVEEVVRPVKAVILLGRPRLLFVRGRWDRGRFGNSWVARGSDYLHPEKASGFLYCSPRRPE